MATQNFMRNLLLNLYREGKISLFVSSCRLREKKMSDTCRLFPPFGDPWPSCLLPSHQQIWKIQLWPQGWKRSVLILIPKKGSTKECLNHWTIALISYTSKVMLKILQARLQHRVTWELPDVQAWFRKGRGNRHQISNICWIIEKARDFQKTPLFHWIL